MGPANKAVGQPLLLHAVISRYPPVGLDMVVHLLDVSGRQLLQLDMADAGDDVVLNVVGIAGRCRFPDLRLGVGFKPDPHPLLHRVGLRFSEVDPLSCFLRFSQLVLDLRLRPAQHILENLFSGLRVPARCESTLPASVLALADISLAIGSFFRHIDRLLSATQHTTSSVK